MKLMKCAGQRHCGCMFPVRIEMLESIARELLRAKSIPCNFGTLHLQPWMACVDDAWKVNCHDILQVQSMSEFHP